MYLPISGEIITQPGTACQREEWSERLKSRTWRRSWDCVVLSGD